MFGRWGIADNAFFCIELFYESTVKVWRLGCVGPAVDARHDTPAQLCLHCSAFAARKFLHHMCLCSTLSFGIKACLFIWETCELPLTEFQSLYRKCETEFRIVTHWLRCAVTVRCSRVRDHPIAVLLELHHLSKKKHRHRPTYWGTDVTVDTVHDAILGILSYNN